MTRRRNESAPGWVWMLFGLGLGLIVALGVYLRVPPTGEPSTRTGPAATTSPRTASPRQTATAPREENRFEFYEILPQIEVAVPESSSERATRPARQPPAAAPGSYLLQAGSFSAAGDADRLQASLALLGFESHVQRALVDGALFNRVRIGPIADLDAAKRAQRRLRDAGIDSLLMQVPQ
ncbi:MAG TPA: SPOR domain-containing protein [Gammaproteobacteria bacterium]|nr:SPOR domain-containing protein [Gammaproteobacteria bacterium]